VRVGVIVVVAIVAVLGLPSLVAPQRDGDGPRAVGGHSLLVVLSGSMSPTIEAGDLLVDQTLSPAEASTLPVGQVVTVRRNDALVTHRITDVVHSGGRVSYVTKGDANASADGQAVLPDEVVGTVRFRVPLLGSVLTSLRDPLVAASTLVALLLVCVAWVLWRASRTD
jgi:signal peptidase